MLYEFDEDEINLIVNALETYISESFDDDNNAQNLVKRIEIMKGQ